MREPCWRGPGDTNWGLPPTRRRLRLRPLVAVPALWDVRRELGSRRTKAALAQVDGLRVSLGSGRTVPAGWYGLDLVHRGDRIFPADLTAGLPMADNSVAALLAEHFVEHLFYDDIPVLLAECLRVLAPGAPLRIVCPDARQVARLLDLGSSAEQGDPAVAADVEMHRWPADGLNWARTLNRISHQWGQHRSLLTADIVIRLMSIAGFTDLVSPPVPQTVHFGGQPPDLHATRFPDEDASLNFAVEGRAPEPGQA